MRPPLEHWLPLLLSVNCGLCCLCYLLHSSNQLAKQPPHGKEQICGGKAARLGRACHPPSATAIRFKMQGKMEGRKTKMFWEEESVKLGFAFWIQGLFLLLLKENVSPERSPQFQGSGPIEWDVLWENHRWAWLFWHLSQNLVSVITRDAKQHHSKLFSCPPFGFWIS